MVSQSIKAKVKHVLHWHFSGTAQSAVVFSSPRGGSTWVSELIASLPGYWPIDEPFNIRYPLPAKELSLESFADLYMEKNKPRIRSYYQKLLQGEYSTLKYRPGDRFYRPITWRVVVKQNQALLDRIGWFTATFGVKAVHLVRHPIAVALSRKVFPLLPDFDRCELRSRFSTEQLQLADKLIATGDHLERGVLAWCLHHAPALWDHDPSWLLISYEHCVVEPNVVLGNLAGFLGEEKKVEHMLRILERPSSVIGLSDNETRRLMESGENRNFLVSKWRRKVDAARESELLDILKEFKVDIYQAGKDIPVPYKGNVFFG